MLAVSSDQKIVTFLAFSKETKTFKAMSRGSLKFLTTPLMTEIICKTVKKDSKKMENRVEVT